jgi:hypothetical protein
VGFPAACVSLKGQKAPTVDGNANETPARITPADIKKQTASPIIGRAPYAFLPLIFGEEAEVFL